MRLLYLSCDPGVPVLGHKGASVHLREMVDAFSAAGASVLVASPRIEPDGDDLSSIVDLVEIDPVRPAHHQSLDSLHRAMAEQTRQVRMIAERHCIEAIYERMSLFGVSGTRTAKRLGLPHALEANAPLCEEALRFRELPHPEAAARIEARVQAASDHVFAVSEPLAARLVAEGVSRAKVTVAPNGVNPCKFRRSRSRAAGEPFTIGFAGSLKPWHGIGVLLEAFAEALEHAPDIRLEIVGGGPERAAVEQAALPPERFTYHGALPHTATIEVLTGWDLGVAPFLPLRGFYFSPLKVVEYMAAGLCPVASDLGQIRTLLGGGSRGVLVEPGSPEALAAEIVRLAADRARADELGAQARTYALGSLSWRRNAERALGVMAAGSRVPAARR